MKAITSVGLSVLLAALTSLACENSASESKQPTGPSEEVASDSRKGSAEPGSGSSPTEAAAPTRAELGKPAPDFSLKDLGGKQVRLADFKGKTVVLEWFNPECPFVKLSHTEGSLRGLAKKRAPGDVVWLAVNSGGEGLQGAGADKNKQGVEAFGMDYPVLLDPLGTVGKAYGATNTPHMFVINPEGRLVYHGAIDNSPDGEGKSPSGGTLVNYVAQALDELAAGKPVSVPETKAYGCSVKYSES